MAVDRTRLKRFPPVQRLWRLGLLVVFMILSVTGIAWMYFETPWGRGLAEQFGGFTGTLEIHRIAGLVMLAGFVLHIVYNVVPDRLEEVFPVLNESRQPGLSMGGY